MNTYSHAYSSKGGCGGKRVAGVNPATLQIAKHREGDLCIFMYTCK